ncbi:MAG: SDR family oxidoreductase [Leptospiraceae bacterium]|nr:SDR family oxidoreductase [Leptospiraceae bacterium]
MNRTVLITGASLGIGKEIAKLFAEDGSNLVLVARNKAKLDAIAKEWKNKYEIKVEPIAIDLSKPGSAKSLYVTLSKKKINIDVLVNNAGFGVNGEFSKNKYSDESEMVHLNIVALTELSHLLLPGMHNSDVKVKGILNVASTAAFQAGPYMSNYYATKAYVLSLSEGLHHELKSQKIHVTCLCPGPTKTEFFDRADMNDNNLLKNEFLLATAEFVAQVGYHAFEKNKAIAIPGFLNSLLAQSPRITPRFLIRRIAALMNKG